MRHTKAQFTRSVAHLKLRTRSMVHWFMSYSNYSIFQVPPVCLCVPWSVALKATMVLPALMLQKPTQIMRPRSMHVTCVGDRLGLWLGHICTKAVASNNTLHWFYTVHIQYIYSSTLLYLYPVGTLRFQVHHGQSCTRSLCTALQGSTQSSPPAVHGCQERQTSS